MAWALSSQRYDTSQFALLPVITLNPHHTSCFDASCSSRYFVPLALRQCQVRPSGGQQHHRLTDSPVAVEQPETQTRPEIGDGWKRQLEPVDRDEEPLKQAENEIQVRPEIGDGWKRGDPLLHPDVRLPQAEGPAYGTYLLGNPYTPETGFVGRREHQ